MAKYECVKDFQCEVCNVKGMLQIISKNYGRVRHYTGLDPLSKKPMFQYHRQSKEYTEQKLRESRSNQILDQSGQLFIDPNLLNLGLSKQNRRACSSVRLILEAF